MSDSFHIRLMQPDDLPSWAAMRGRLWPEESEADHIAAILRLLASDTAWGFIAETSEREAAGFAELALRPYANGCDSQPVPFLEGIWVEARFRRRGIGRGLLAYVTEFLLACSYEEIGSDTPLDNIGSQAAHRAWGFSETERVVYFRKRLNPRPPSSAD